MEDNKVSGIVKKGKDEDPPLPALPLNSICDKPVEIGEEIKTFDHQSGELILDEISSHDTSQLEQKKREVKNELSHKEQPEIQIKNEDFTSEFQSAGFIPRPVPKPDTIEKEEIITEEVNQEKKDTNLFSKSLNSSNPSSSTEHDRTITIPAVSNRMRHNEKYLLRNQSDILPSLKEIPKDEDASLMIFSHKGLPTKKYIKRKDVVSSILPFGFDEKDVPPTPGYRNKVELTPKISQIIPKVEEERKKHLNPLSDKNPNVPTTPNIGISRNVLTGSGVNSLDEFKNKSTRRKDGNPLLGIGYDEPVIPNSTGRVPPGGFSSGLW